MADNSGGRFFMADTLSHLTEVFARIAQELRQQYSISYYPKNQTPDARLRQIKVRVSTPNVAVRARRSYVFKSATGKATSPVARR
jgi:VWFA-related protein